MNQMQQMLANAQRMQRELNKANAAIAATEFPVSKNGMVNVVVMGDRTIKSLEIDNEALDPENKDMLLETLRLALNEAFEAINKAYDEAEERVTKRSGGLF